MLRWIRAAVSCALAVTVITGTSWAQTPASTSPVELAVGYQFQRLGGDDGTNIFKGAFVDASFGGKVAGVFQLGASFKSENETFTFGTTSATSEAKFSVSRLVAGVRFYGSSAGTTPYFHLLGGVVRLAADATSTTTGPGVNMVSSFEDSETKATAQVGAGIGIRLSDRVNLRLGADYQRVFAEDGGNIFLASVGVAFKLR
jgi:hypothetical protein